LCGLLQKFSRNPLFIGASIRTGIDMVRGDFAIVVAIPSSSGRVFGLESCTTRTVARLCRNPLFIGASIRTHQSADVPAPLRSRNPLFIGASIRTMEINEYKYPSDIVAIPSSSGRVFGPGRLPRTLSKPERSQSPLHRGEYSDWEKARYFPPGRYRSQSPLHRGEYSDGTRPK